VCVCGGGVPDSQVVLCRGDGCPTCPPSRWQRLPMPLHAAPSH
jgi:hypothetical protein